jgi:hypothetical protein
VRVCYWWLADDKWCFGSVNAVKHDQNKKLSQCTWPYIKQFVMDKRKYADLYVKLLRAQETSKKVRSNTQHIDTDSISF